MPGYYPFGLKDIGGMQEMEPYYGGQAFQKSLAPQAAAPAASTAETATAVVPFMATPAGAAATIGSQFLMGYMAQRAADERAKRERAAQIAQVHGQQEQQGLENLINVYRSALG